MQSFKAPAFIPQDLALIQDILGPLEVPKSPKPIFPQVKPEEDDDINSSASEGNASDSEDEVAANLTMIQDDHGSEEEDMPLARSLSPSSSSDSDSDSDEIFVKDNANNVDSLADDEDEAGPSVPAQSYFRTKNEAVEDDVTIPEIEAVGPDEHLEKVGEILNIIDSVVIVKGLPSDDPRRGLDRALDSETLLVFDDRKVLGYVYETFGPTSQPLYQVRFNSTFPLNAEQATVSREVFHVPQRSRFVFLNQIAHFKGSDASNVNDEEPADHELEFSDDEAESAWKNRNKRRRAESRASSVASSRLSTPQPSQLRDQDMEGYSLGSDAYAAQGPYDDNFSATPSRPAPIPYDDDPYSEAFSGVSPGLPPPPSPPATKAQTTPTSPLFADTSEAAALRPVARSRGRGRGASSQDRRGGRERGRGRGGRGRGGSSGNWPHQDQHQPPSYQRPLAGHYDGGHQQAEASQYAYNDPVHGSWAAPGPSTYPEQPPNDFVQPHINPRFAAQFAMPPPFGQAPPVPAPGHPQYYDPTNYGQVPGPYDYYSGSMSQWGVPPDNSR